MASTPKKSSTIEIASTAIVEQSANRDAPVGSAKVRDRHSLIRGAPDLQGREVMDVFAQAPNYTIYSTRDGLHYLIDDDLDTKDAQEINDRYFQVSDEIADFNHLVFVMEPRFAARSITAIGRAKFAAALSYERELARCLGKALDGYVDEARYSMERLLQNMRRQTTNRVRVLHLAINLACTVIVWLCSVIYISVQSSIFGFNIQFIAIAAVMGSIGALFSTATRLASMPVDPTVSLRVQWVYASQRILVGVLGAIILLFGFESGILQSVVLPPAGEVAPADVFGPRPPAFIYWLGFMCILAGFSERLVPNLLLGESEKLIGINRPKPPVNDTTSKPVPKAKE